jgi:DNA uptake protein ComE-like DNA-binding protein
LTAVLQAGQPADADAVKTVCGRCHTTAVFEGKPRAWDRWNDVFADMTQRGANGTNEQLGRVTRYFLENLTLVNMNTSDAEEIAGILEVGDDVADAIIQRRRARPFAGLADLRSVAGVDAARVDQRKARISF